MKPHRRSNWISALALVVAIFAVAAHAATYKETTLYNFHGQKDAAQPGAGLVADAAGNLYGTSLWGGGGCSGRGCGAIFELSPSSTVWTEKVIYGFKGFPDAENPTSGLIIDASGNLYGTAFTGGASNGGAIFELSPSGAGWTENILYSFSGTAGSYPANLISDAAGNFYGVAEGGGANSAGTVWELSPASGGGWTVSVLYSFTGGKDGASPDSLTMDAAGNLYGATFAAGDPTCSGLSGTGCGTVFSLQPSGGSWILHLLYTFHGTHGPNGANPFASVVLDSAGNLYGGTRGGGINQYGVVYKLAPTAVGEWTETILHRFTNGTDGAEPSGGLKFDAAGNLYGAADGTEAISPSPVFRLSPSSSGGWIFAVVYTFPSSGAGAAAGGPSYFDAAGNLFGTAGGGTGSEGIVYELTK